MTLDPAKDLLAKAPALQAKLQPAAWTNGYTSVCRGTYFYDYEVKGVTAHDGFVRGAAPLPKASAGQAAASPAAAPPAAGS